MFVLTYRIIIIVIGRLRGLDGPGALPSVWYFSPPDKYTVHVTDLRTRRRGVRNDCARTRTSDQILTCDPKWFLRIFWRLFYAPTRYHVYSNQHGLVKKTDIIWVPTRVIIFYHSS